MNRLTGMVSALCPDGIPHVSMGSLMNRSREKAKSDNSIIHRAWFGQKTIE